MKKLLLLIVFVVTWKTYQASELNSSYMYTLGGNPQVRCELKEVEQRKEFQSATEASRFAEEIGKDRKNWDIEIWRMEKTK